MRLVSLSAAIVLSLFVPFAQAQTCTPPTIVQIGGTNPSCPGQPVTLDAGSGWTSYQWSVGGGTNRLLTDTPSATTSYTVTVTGSNGCQVTSAPIQIVVNDNPPVPTVTANASQYCVNGAGEATVGGGPWTSISWSIGGGTISSGATATTVQFLSGSSSSVQLTATVIDANGCSATGTTTVPVRNFEPTLTITPSSICPMSPASATLSGPPDGWWTDVQWSVAGGQASGYQPIMTELSFMADNSGQPVTVTAVATDSHGCQHTASAQAQIRSIPPPALTAHVSELCPMSPATVTLGPPAEGYWVDVEWSVQNGHAAGYQPLMGEFNFMADNSGQPVIVTATVRDDRGCEATNSVTIPIRTIPPPTLTPSVSEICPMSPATVTLSLAEGTLSNVEWSIQNGHAAGYQPLRGEFNFMADNSGLPVIVTATARDDRGCEATNSVTIPIRTIPPPTLTPSVSEICPMSPASVTLSLAEGTLSSVDWSIQNGHAAGYQPLMGEFNFMADNSGLPVIVTATARDDRGCEATNSVTIPVRTIPPPTLNFYPEQVCAGAFAGVYLSAPAEGSWSDVTWTIQNGTASESQPGMMTRYLYAGTNGQPVIVTVTARDSFGCETTASVTIPIRTIPTPTLDFYPAQVCPGSMGSVYLPAPADMSTNWANVQWSIQNGTAAQNQPGMSSFYYFADNSGQPVTITATATDSLGCTTTTSTTIPIRAITAPALDFYPAQVCPGAMGSVYLPRPADMNTDWANVQWSIQNGTASQSQPGMSSFYYHADNSGQPVIITATATDTYGCTATTSTTIPIRTITPPALDVYPPQVCPGAMGSVYLPRPSDMNTDWANVQWSVQNGTAAPSQPGMSAFYYHADNSGQPVTITATATDTYGCTTTTSVTIPVRMLAPPEITNPPVCAGATSTAFLAPPPEGGSWANVQWSIENGTANPDQPYMTSLDYTAGTNGQPVVITAVVTDSYGCSVTTTKSIPVVAPAPVILAPDSICPDDTIRVDVRDPSSYPSFQWSVSAGGSIHGRTDRPWVFLRASPGVTSVTVSLTTQVSGCSPVTTSRTIAVRQTPVPQVTRPASICPGSSGTATVENASEFTTFSWSALNATITSANNTPSVTFTATNNSVTLILNARSVNGCTVRETYSIASSTAPPPVLATWPGDLCPTNSSYNAAVENPGDYTSVTWNVVNATITTTYRFPDARISYQPTGAGPVQITAHGHSADGCVSTTTITKQLEAPATITAGGPTTFCEGGQVTLTAEAGSAYQWAHGPTTQSVTVTAGGTYTVNVTRASGCMVSGSMTVNVTAKPDATITGPATFCPGQSATLTAPAGMSSYSWSNGATTRSITTNSTGTFTVTVTNAQGCSATSAPFTTTRTPPPAPEVTFTTPQACLGAQNTATVANASNYTSFTWSAGSSEVSIVGSNSGSSVDFNVNWWSGSPARLNVTATTADGCVVTGGGEVSVPWMYVDITSDPSVCRTSSSSAWVTDHGAGATYAWTIEGGFAYGATDSSYLSFGADEGATSVTISVTVTRDGCTQSSTRTLPVDYPPQAVIESYPQAVCDVEDYTVTAADGGAGATYSWHVFSGSIVSGQGTRTITVRPNGPGYIMTSLNVGHGTNCHNHTSVQTYVASPTVPTITEYQYGGGDGSFCPEELGVYLQASTGFDTYTWSNGMTGRNIYVQQPGNYTVTGARNGCSRTSAPFTVTQNPGADATITASGPTAICNGDSVTLTAPAGHTYAWSNGATTQSITVSTAGTYSVTTTTPNGCTATSSPVNVTVNPRPQTPYMSFSPYPHWPGSGYAAASWCEGMPVTITTGPDVPGVTYTWSNGATGLSTTVTTEGYITATATNASGCSSSFTYYINYIDAPNPVITSEGPSTSCDRVILSIPYQGASRIQWQERYRGIQPGQGTEGYPYRFEAIFSGEYQVIAEYPNGCTIFSDYFPVTVNRAPALNVRPWPAYLCPNGSVTLSTEGENHLVTSYLWSTGETTPTITVNQPGNYTVTVTGANGCSRTHEATVYLRQTTAPTIGTTGPTTFCEGGSVRLYNNSLVTHLWSTGETTSSILVTTSGTYTVRGTDANGCEVESAATVVTVNPRPDATVTASGPTTFCAGGSVTLTAAAGYNYAWSNGATTQSITVSSGGTYRVTVTDPATSCSNTSAWTTVVVNPAASAPTVTASGPTTFCPGGSVTLTAPAGYASYAWSNGGTGQSITVSDAGSYNVTVTNASGCSATSADTVVTVRTAPNAAIGVAAYFDGRGATLISQNGNTYNYCGPFDLQLTSTLASSYSWSTGSTDRSIITTTAGTYTVTVTDANGCTNSATVNIVQVPKPPAPTVSASSPALCPAGSVTLTASNGGEAYLWNNGATTQSITVTEPGMFFVRASVNGCFSNPSMPVFVGYGKPTIEVAGSTTLCGNGSSVTLTAPAADSYAWSNGATTRSIVVDAAGLFTVRTTTNGCQSDPSDPVSVTEREVTVTADGPTTFCALVGNVTLTASPADSYAWSNGANTQSITVSESGVYFVTNSWSDGCSIQSEPVNVVAEAPEGTIASNTTSACDGGSIHFTSSVTGGSGFTYQWYDNTYTPIAGATGPTLTHTPTTNGFVYLKVTSASGCEDTSNAISYKVGTAPSFNLVAPESVCSGSYGSAHLDPQGGPAAEWSIEGGMITASYPWMAVFTPTGTGPVTITATVRNAAGCAAARTATIAVNPSPAPPVVTADGPTAFCEGGSVTLTAPDGFASYQWSNGLTTRSITVNYPSTYMVTVTDANGCQATSAGTAVTVHSLPAVPSITASGPLTFCAGGSVRLTAPAGYSYSWSNGSIEQFIDVTTSGSYSVTVRNANGCERTSAAKVVTVNAPPATPSITADGPLAFCGTTRRLTAPAGYSYLWSNGSTDQFIDVTISGTYRVTITDANGCSATSADTVVTVNTPPATPSITADGPLTFCQGPTRRLTAPAGYASYLWNNGSTDSFVDVTTSGTFRVTVTDANGCSATSADTVITVHALPATPNITADGPLSFCQGPTRRLTAPAGYSYLWSNGSTDPYIDVTTSGTFRVTVTNANGCSATSPDTVVTVNAPPATPDITADGPLSFCQGPTRRLTAPAGYASYLWNNGSTDSFVDVTTSGTFRVTVTDANGCSATSADTVVTVHTQPAQPNINADGPLTFCQGPTRRLTAPAGYASYLWNNGSTDSFIDVTTSGTFRVTVTNANGCSATSADTVVTVNAPPATPAITADGALTFCQGPTRRLSAPAGYASYLWNNGSTDSFVDVTATGTFRVTVTDANGCSATSADTDVTVNARPATPTINADGPLTFCQGPTRRLTAPAGYSYLWNNGSTDQYIDVTTSGTFRVTITNANGCSATSADTVVTVNARPATPAITADGPLTFCQGPTRRLSAPAGYASYLWNNGSTDAYVDVTASGTFRVTVTDANGCSATSADTTVTVNPLPDTTVTLSGSPTLCPGQSVTLTAPANMTSYSWSNGATSPSITVNSTGNYTVTVVGPNGCSAMSAPVNVVMRDATTITQEPANVTMLRNQTRQLTAAATGAGTLTYTWYRGTVGDTSQPHGTGTSVTVGPYTKRGTYNFWLRVTSSACPNSRDDSRQVVVTVN